MKIILLFLLLSSVLVGPVLATGNVTYTSPTGGEFWFKGTTHALIYSLSQTVGYHMVTLNRNGNRLGFIRFTNFPTDANQVITYPWKVGEVKDDNGNPVQVLPGSGYYISVGLQSGMVASEQFSIGPDVSSILAKINKIYYAVSPKPSGCPQCLILDLKSLREKLINLDEPVAAGLYWKGRTVANLGKIGKGRGFSAQLQVKLGSEAFAAMNRGEEFELRLFAGRKQLIHSQSVLLMAASPIRHNIEQIQKH